MLRSGSETVQTPSFASEFPETEVRKLSLSCGYKKKPRFGKFSFGNSVSNLVRKTRFCETQLWELRYIRVSETRFSLCGSRKRVLLEHRPTWAPPKGIRRHEGDIKSTFCRYFVEHYSASCHSQCQQYAPAPSSSPCLVVARAALRRWHVCSLASGSGSPRIRQSQEFRSRFCIATRSPPPARSVEQGLLVQRSLLQEVSSVDGASLSA